MDGVNPSSWWTWMTNFFWDSIPRNESSCYPFEEGYQGFHRPLDRISSLVKYSLIPITLCYPRFRWISTTYTIHCTRARGSERVVLDRFADLVGSMSFFICPIGSIPSIAVTNQVSTLINYWDVNPLLISGFLLHIDKKNSSYHLISVWTKTSGIS